MHRLKAKLLDLQFELNPPVPPQDLTALEAQWGETLPRAAREMLDLFDGVKSLPGTLNGEPVRVMNDDLRFMSAREMTEFLQFFPEYGMYDEEQNMEGGAFLDGGISDLRDLILPFVENSGSDLFFFFRHELLQDFVGYLDHNEAFHPRVAFFSLEHLAERIEVFKAGRRWEVQYDHFDPAFSQGDPERMHRGMEAMLERAQQEGMQGRFTRAGYFFSLACGLVTRQSLPRFTELLFDPVIGSPGGNLILDLLRTLKDWNHFEAIPLLEQKLRGVQGDE